MGKTQGSFLRGPDSSSRNGLGIRGQNRNDPEVVYGRKDRGNRGPNISFVIVVLGKLDPGKNRLLVQGWVYREDRFPFTFVEKEKD